MDTLSSSGGGFVFTTDSPPRAKVALSESPLVLLKSIARLEKLTSDGKPNERLRLRRVFHGQLANPQSVRRFFTIAER